MRKLILLALASVFVMGVAGCPEDDNGKDENRSLAKGSFNGSFNGTGNLVVNGMTANCTEMIIEIDTDDQTYFNVAKWEYSCGGFTGENSPVSADIVEGRVIMDGRDVGTFVNSTVSLSVSEGGESWSLQASAFDDRIEVREAFNNSEYDVVVNGTLERENPETTRLRSLNSSPLQESENHFLQIENRWKSVRLYQSRN